MCDCGAEAMTRDALMADAERRGEARGLVAGRAEVVARVEGVLARWDDAILDRLPLTQRVPLRHARDDLRAALTDPGDALPDEQGA